MTTTPAPPTRSLRAAPPAHPTRRHAGAAALAALPLLALPALVPAHATVVAEPIVHSADDAPFELTPLGSFDTGVFDESAAEVLAFHAATARLFVVNAREGAVEVLDTADVTAPARVGSIDPAGLEGSGGFGELGDANSVAVRRDGLGIVVVAGAEKVDPGRAVFFDAASLAILGSVEVGALPDMVTVSPDGRYAVVANEGEPADDYSADPEGTVSVIGLPRGLAAPAQDDVATADFRSVELSDGVRVFGPEVPLEDEGEYLPAQNLEPEYVAVDARSRTAYVTLQENNAIAVVDLASATVTDVHPLGTKDHSLEGHGFDASDRDDAVHIATWPVRGLYLPDALAAYTSRGQQYLVTANEGDAREWEDSADESLRYVEAERVEDLIEDGRLCGPLLAELDGVDLGDTGLGRLEVSIASGVEDGCIAELHSFGARSLSIWDTDGELVFDSGDEVERVTAAALGDAIADGETGFNSNHSATESDSRSDAKGPEPEAVAVGKVGSRTYAFLGLERVGGIMVYDVTVPAASTFVTYVNNRDFSVSVEDVVDAAEAGETDADPAAALAQAGDLGPEGLVFIPATESPTGGPLLAVGNEVSGTTTLYAVGETSGERTGWAGGRPGAGR